MHEMAEFGCRGDCLDFVLACGVNINDFDSVRCHRW